MRVSPVAAAVVGGRAAHGVRRAEVLQAVQSQDAADWSPQVSLTPSQRHDLVSKAIGDMQRLGMALIPVTSHQAWNVDPEQVRGAYDSLCDTVRKMMHEIDWPGHRGVDSGNASTTS